MNRGLYLHFPFCEKKCFYCDFYSLADFNLKEEYINALIREITKFDGVKIDTVFFGGGTPSLLTVSELERIMSAIYRSFKVETAPEITLEANPMSINEVDKLKSFKSLGINRLSIGIQSFSDSELKMLGRRHTKDQAINTVMSAKEAGFDNVSVDLMFALPCQSEESFKESVNTALTLPFSHISLYALSIEENTVFGRKRQKGIDLHLPENDLEMYLLACEILKNNGFEHYEISNFAKDGKRSRHNMKYWQSEEYIGIGASAHSYFDGVRYAFPPSVKDFIKNPEREEVYKNTPKDRAEEFIMLSLRLSDGLDLKRLEEEYKITLTDGFYTLLDALEKNALLKQKNNRVALTDKGFFVSNSIIVEIMDKLEA